MDASATEENHTENNVAGAIENSANLKQESVENMGAGAGEKSWPGWPGENVFRILAPSHKVGSIIGRKGEFIKKICEESKARVKILDSRPGAPERMVIISAKEEPDLSISPAMNGLLQVHKRLIDGLDGDSTKGPPNPGNAVLTRLLVGATQAGSLIGKQGSTIKSFQEASGAVVRVVDELPSVALPDDRVVEIQGEPAAVHTALELISNHLRKFLVDRSVLPLFEIQNLQMEHSVQVVQQPQPWSHPQGIRPSAGGYGVGVGVGTGADPQYVPPHPHDNYFRPPDLPALEKQPHPGIATYGRDPQSMGGYAAANQQYGREAPPMGSYAAANQQSAAPMVAPVTQHMQIPLSFVNAVVGAAGANISYIRRASGATVMIQETRGVPGEMTVEISGGATQIQTAQQLIQNFMAEAGSAVAAPAQNAIGSADPVYESYQPPQGFYATGSAAAAASGPPYDSYYSY